VVCIRRRLAALTAAAPIALALPGAAQATAPDAGWTDSGCLMPNTQCYLNDPQAGSYDFFNESDGDGALFAGPEISPTTGTNTPTDTEAPLSGYGDAAQITQVGGENADAQLQSPTTAQRQACLQGGCLPAEFAGISDGCWQGYCEGSQLPIPVGNLGSHTITVTYDNDASGASPPSSGTFDDELNLWFLPPSDVGKAPMQENGLNMIISNGGDVNGQRSKSGVGGCNPAWPFYQTGVSLDGGTWTVCSQNPPPRGWIDFVRTDTSAETETIHPLLFAYYASGYGYLPAGFDLSNVSAFHEIWTNQAVTVGGTAYTAVKPNELTIENLGIN
jgi:hypothetical protein